MAVAETNKIITHGDGQSIATSIQNIANAINDQEKNVHLSDAQTITGAKTFTSPIKTSEIDNTSGNAMLRDKSTEGAIVLGSVSKKAVIMGSGNRPTYSKDGSDFAGSELALKSDVIVDASTLWANLGIGRWANQQFRTIYSSSINTVYDDLAKHYTSCVRYMSGMSFYNELSNDLSSAPINFNNPADFFNTSISIDFTYAFSNIENATSITLPSMYVKESCAQYMFAHSKFTEILIADGCDVKNLKWNCDFMFYNCSNLTHIGKFNMTSVSTGPAWNMFTGCTKLKRIECTNWRVNLRISQSTSYEEADLVEIIGNLVDVGADRTLMIGATNRAKLTAEEIAVATIKGWTIA